MMQYTTTYQSPLGSILLAADHIGLTGLWFDGAKYFAHGLNPEHTEGDLPDKKAELLALEGVDCNALILPAKGSGD